MPPHRRQSAPLRPHAFWAPLQQFNVCVCVRACARTKIACNVLAILCICLVIFEGPSSETTCFVAQKIGRPPAEPPPIPQTPLGRGTKRTLGPRPYREERKPWPGALTGNAPPRIFTHKMYIPCCISAASLLPRPILYVKALGYAHVGRCPFRP